MTVVASQARGANARPDLRNAAPGYMNCERCRSPHYHIHEGMPTVVALSCGSSSYIEWVHLHKLGLAAIPLTSDHEPVHLILCSPNLIASLLVLLRRPPFFRLYIAAFVPARHVLRYLAILRSFRNSPFLFFLANGAFDLWSSMSGSNGIVRRGRGFTEGSQHAHRPEEGQGTAAQARSICDL